MPRTPMIGPLRTALERLFGRPDAESGASDDEDGDAGGADDQRSDEARGEVEAEPSDDRIEGSGRPILDEVYGQPGVAREVERIEWQARELEDDRRFPISGRAPHLEVAGRIGRWKDNG